MHVLVGIGKGMMREMAVDNWNP